VNRGIPTLLIVTQSFEVGGLETYIAGQVRVMAAAGWKMHMACGSSPTAEFLPAGLSSVTGGISLGPNSTAAELVGTVETLRAIIREHAVTHVHAHPFTSLFPAMLAAALEGVPFIFTLHGPASLSIGYGPFNDFLLTSLVLPQASLVLAVSEEVEELAAPYVGAEQLCVQNNAIDFARFRLRESPVAKDAPWLLVSRLDGLKIPGIRAFVNQASALALGRVDIVGDGPGRETLLAWLEEDGIAGIARFLGASSQVSELMRSSAGVAGMGRVLLEGVACGKPVCMVGYDGVKGLLDPDLFRLAAYANFSGRNLPNVSEEQLRSQFAHTPLESAELREVANRHHSEDLVWADFSKRITSLTCNAQLQAQALYSVLRSEEVVASPSPYLTSEELFYRIGQVLHGAAFYSPVTAASYEFYRTRMQAQLSGKANEETRTSIMQAFEAARLDLRSAVSEATAPEAGNGEKIERLLSELQQLGEQVQHLGMQDEQLHGELVKALRQVENAIVEAAASVPPDSWPQRISDALKSLRGRAR